MRVPVLFSLSCAGYADTSTMRPLEPAPPLAQGQHFGILLVEAGVGITVTGVMVAIYYAFAARTPDHQRRGVVSMDLMTAEFFFGHLNYWLFIILMMTGLYIVVAKGNLVKKIVGLNIFQTSVFMFYISIGNVTGGTAPIFPLDMKIDPDVIYSNPLPHVLILTAIVVGVATTALGLALIVRIREEFGTIEEDALLELEHEIARKVSDQHGEAMGGRHSGD